MTLRDQEENKKGGGGKEKNNRRKEKPVGNAEFLRRGSGKKPVFAQWETQGAGPLKRRGPPETTRRQPGVGKYWG